MLNPKATTPGKTLHDADLVEMPPGLRQSPPAQPLDRPMVEGDMMTPFAAGAGGLIRPHSPVACMLQAGLCLG